MEILKPLKFMLKYIGLLFTYSDSVNYKIFGYFGCFALVLFIYPVVSAAAQRQWSIYYKLVFISKMTDWLRKYFPQGLYVVSTFHNVQKFSEIMPVYAGMINSCYKACWFIFYRKEVIFCLNKTQEIVDSGWVVSSKIQYRI